MNWHRIGYNNTRLRSGVLLLGLLILLGGCATAPQTERLLADSGSVDGLHPMVELNEVPFFPQEQYQCGPAALATVLNYRGQTVTPQALKPKVFVPGRQGSFQLEMAAAARQYGMVAYPLEPSMQALLQEVQAGNPVLVLQNVGLDFYPKWHFAVVVGYSLAQGHIILRSGTQRRWVTSLRNFEHTWRKSRYWGLVVTAPQVIPVSARIEGWMRAAHDLQMVGQVAAAESAYRVATERWPEALAGWLALGNVLYQQNRHEEGVALFEQMRLRFEDRAVVWNNYAYVLQARGCFQAALKAAHCAVHLTPGDANVQQTLSEMKDANPGRSDPEACPAWSCNF